MRHHAKTTGNGIPLDNTHIMSVFEDGPSNREFGTTCFSDAEKYSTTDIVPTQDHDYVEVPTIFSLSENKEAVIAYIAGCVTRMAMKKTR